MKKLLFVTALISIGTLGFAQDTQKKNNQKADQRKRREVLAKQDEEGVLNFNRHTAGGIQLRTNGYGAFLEIARVRSPRFANLFTFELTEIKHNKEEKAAGDGFFSNSFVYGKINNFYQAKLGFGQQYIFGQKGNKNGVAVLGIVNGGLSMGLLKPYYIQERTSGRDIKYDSEDSLLFISGPFAGGSGFSKGWSELKIRPGAYLKTALRFDFGRFNESIHALEIGMSLDFYPGAVPQMVYNEPKRFFFQGHIAYIFGRRK